VSNFDKILFTAFMADRIWHKITKLLQLVKHLYPKVSTKISVQLLVK